MSEGLPPPEKNKKKKKTLKGFENLDAEMHAANGGIPAEQFTFLKEKGLTAEQINALTPEDRERIADLHAFSAAAEAAVSKSKAEPMTDTLVRQSLPRQNGSQVKEVKHLLN